MIPVTQDTKADVQHRLLTARNYIDRHYDLPLTLKQLATHVHVSPFHFLRLFKERFGKTPHQYLRQKRIDQAKYYLARSHLTVTAVCFKVGFESPGSFSSLFAKP